MQIDNVGRTSAGIRYKSYGKRMSGDLNTALGNCLINLIVIYCVFRDVHFDVMLDGDDSIIIVEDGNQHVASEKIFLEYGFRTKLAFHKDVQDVEFCQSKLVWLSDGPSFVRKPEKVLLGLGCTFQHHRAIRQYVATVGMAESIVGRGVPINYFAGLALVKAAGCVPSEKFRREVFSKEGYEYGRIDTTDRYISHNVRLSYARAFGISPSEQLSIEASFSDYKVEWPKANDTKLPPLVTYGGIRTIDHRGCSAKTPTPSWTQPCGEGDHGATFTWTTSTDYRSHYRCAGTPRKVPIWDEWDTTRTSHKAQATKSIPKAVPILRSEVRRR